MRGRSLTAMLSLAFGGTTLAVFVLVGSFVYIALDRQVKTQDDLEIVLAARHARRLTREIDTIAGIREHADRLSMPHISSGSSTASIGSTRRAPIRSNRRGRAVTSDRPDLGSRSFARSWNCMAAPFTPEATQTVRVSS